MKYVWCVGLSAALGALMVGVAVAEAYELSAGEMAAVGGGMPPPNNCCNVEPCCQFECTYYDEGRCVYKIPMPGHHCWTPPTQWGQQEGCVGQPLGDPPADAAKCCMIVTVDPDGPCHQTQTGAQICDGAIQGAQYESYTTHCDAANCKALVMHRSPSRLLERCAWLRLTDSAGY